MDVKWLEFLSVHLHLSHLEQETNTDGRKRMNIIADRAGLVSNKETNITSVFHSHLSSLSHFTS